MDVRLAVVFSLILSAQYIIRGSTLSQYEYGLYRHFIVVSSKGNDTEACLNATSLEVSIRNPCKTLDHAISIKKNATDIILEPGVHNLTTNATFENVFGLGLSGNGSLSKVAIHCSPNVSFTFIRSVNIKIRRISFCRCGSLHASTVGSAFREIHKDHVPFYAGIFFAYVKNVAIEDCKITKSPGIGLVLYDVGGEVNMNRSIFSQNSPDPENKCSRNLTYTRAGGGVYVEFTFEGAIPPFNKSNPERLAYQNNNNYVIEGCTFEDNLAPEQCFMNKIEFPSGNDYMPFGRGGGMSFCVKGNATNNTARIRNCNFLNNEGVWGAGLFVEFQDKTQNNTLHILGSTFSNNSNSTAGGAVRSGIPIWGGKLYPNTIIHEDCIYENNSARLGGGVSHYGPYYHPVDADDNYRSIIFKRCQWINNKATIGSAIGLATAALAIPLNNINPNLKGPILPYIVCFEDCSVVGNKIIRTEDKIVIGQGALYTYTVPVIFKGFTKFDSNINTALVLDGAILKVFDNTSFINNKGLQGGAIGMYGMSIIDLMPFSNMHFKGNVAKEKGGAIYVDVSGPPVVAFETTELNTHGCFLAYNDTNTVAHVDKWDTNITFVSNHASVGGGNSIYATSLQGCRRIGEKRINNHSLEWDFIKYTKEDGGDVEIGEEISTDPIKIEIVESEWKISPGEEFAASIKLLDEKGSLVQGVVILSIDASKPSDAKLGISSPLLLIKNIEKDNKVHGLMLKGSCGKSFNLTLRTVSGQTISTTITNQLKLSNCHQGYQIHETEGECVCSKNEVIGISRCDDDKKTVYLKTGYWGGDVDGMRKFDTYSCPEGYCLKRNLKKRDFKLKMNNLCTTNRDSSIALCGECKENYTVRLGSEECVETKTCNMGRLSLLLVFFLVMLIFVLLVLKVNLDIFTAYLNAWLYSYQIIEYLLKENTSFDHDPFMSFVIGLANWRIKGVGICFFPGLTNFYKLGIHYILPFYVLFVLFVLSKIARCFPRCYINRNVSHALCNLLVLCYTDITIISFNLLHYVKVGGKWVLYLDGKINFYDDWQTHLPFTIIAIVLLIFVALLPIVLLFTPWFFRFFPFLNRYRLFFDLFQNCFEDQERQRNNRWFAAFYFLCRLWILLMALYLPLGPLKRSILEASCIIVLGLFLYLQPYNTAYKWLNTLDAVLLTNLCLITVFSSALTSDAVDTTFDGLKTLVNVIAYIPMVYLVILGLVYGFTYFKDEEMPQVNTFSSLLDENTEQEPTSGDSVG
jgi:predicted outer membrane repeat protein